jgi:hypothetical protein
VPELPTEGAFTAGSGVIGPPIAGNLQVQQTSARGIIDWRTFSIGPGGAVSILNGQGATLNRVTGSQMSLIRGTLSATGSVYLVNDLSESLTKETVQHKSPLNEFIPSD